VSIHKDIRMTTTRFFILLLLVGAAFGSCKKGGGYMQAEATAAGVTK
jgi:hypothetical protein